MKRLFLALAALCWLGSQSAANAQALSGPPSNVSSSRVTATGASHSRRLADVLAAQVSIADYCTAAEMASDASTCFAAALTAAGAGELTIPCVTVNWSTPITITSPAMIRGQGLCSVLHYTGTTGVALTFALSSGFSPGFGLKSLQLTGASASNSTTALLLGSGSSGAHFFQATDVSIATFGLGVQFGNQTWLTTFNNVMIFNNGQALKVPAGLTNSGENLDFTDSTFSSGSQPTSATCVDIEGFVDNINFKGGSFDNCPVTINSSNTTALFVGTHFENPAGALPYPFITVTNGFATLAAPNIFLGATPTASALFSAAAGSLISNELWIYNNSGSQLPALFQITGTANFKEANTHPFIGTNGVRNFVLWTGTGRVELSTPPSVVNSKVSYYFQDPYSANNFGSNSQVLNPSPNARAINMVMSSNDVTTSDWSNYNNQPATTLHTTDFTDPFGGNNAMKIVNTLGGNSGRAQFTSHFTLLAGQPYTACVWAKGTAGGETFRYGVADSAATASLTTDWVRYSTTYTPATNTTQTFEFFTGATGTTIGLYGAQTVPGTECGPYTPTGLHVDFVPSVVVADGGLNVNGASVQQGVVTNYGTVTAGTKFAASGCSNSGTTGGATAGAYTSGTAGACTVTITMGGSATAPNGWACAANDNTTPADVITQTGSTTTTATLSGTTASGDVIRFHCVGY